MVKIQDLSFYKNVREKLNNYLEELLKIYPHVDNNYIITKSQLAKKFKVSKPFVIDFIRKYLRMEFGQRLANKINKELWPQGPREYKVKRAKLEDLLIRYMENYPENKHLIPSLQDLSDLLKVERNTITDWLKKYYRQEFGLKQGNEIFKDIWTCRQGGQDVRLNYDYLKQWIRNRGGELITTRDEYNLMKFPTQQYVEIICNDGHQFKPQILHLLYHNSWCPTCNERFCQRIMRLYMESIFEVPFPETSLKDAYGLSADNGGQLRWDGFNERVILNSLIFRVAFEYDGLQHDRWPNAFHRFYRQFLIQQENDQKKNYIAKDERFKTIVIRLKKINGFNRNTIHLFQREIMKQIFNQTGIKLPYSSTLKYDPFTNSLKLRKGPLDKF
jgi:hypothetical protein